MKKYFYVLIAVLGFTLTACGNSNNDGSEAKSETAAEKLSADKALYVENILESAATNVDKEVVLRGYITHTCKHSGRRCFVAGKDQKTSIRVEAKGNIGGFNRELIGSEVVVKGILRETRLSKEYIDQMEEELKDNEGKAEGNGETCDAEMNNINGMRAWMKANNKDFYSLFYVDGMEYEVVE